MLFQLLLICVVYQASNNEYHNYNHVDSNSILISYHLTPKTLNEWSIMYNFKHCQFNKTTSSLLIQLLLLISGVEMNPGTPLDPGPPVRNVPELDSLLSKKGTKMFHQNVRRLF